MQHFTTPFAGAEVARILRDTAAKIEGAAFINNYDRSLNPSGQDVKNGRNKMQKASQRERWEFIHLFMKHANLKGAQTEGDLQRAARGLLRYGATLGRMAEAECNSPDYPAWVWKLPKDARIDMCNKIDKRYQKMLDSLDAKETRIREKVTKLLEPFGCTPVFSGDPRGATLKIKMPDGFTNDWGREGLCVPTS